MKETIIGMDKENGWTTEIVGETQGDGSFLIVSEHRYKATLDIPARCAWPNCNPSDQTGGRCCGFIESNLCP